MHVEHRRLAAAAMLKKGAPGQRQREVPQVSAAGSRNPQRPEPDGSKRQLEQGARGTLDQVRARRRGGITVVGAANRKEAGVIAVALLHQDIEGPLASRPNREAGGAESQYPLPHDVLQYPAALPHV